MTHNDLTYKQEQRSSEYTVDQPSQITGNPERSNNNEDGNQDHTTSAAAAAATTPPTTMSALPPPHLPLQPPNTGGGVNMPQSYSDTAPPGEVPQPSQPPNSSSYPPVTHAASSDGVGYGNGPSATPNSGPGSSTVGGTGEFKPAAQGQPKRLHVSNIPFRFREPDMRQLFFVSLVRA